ncbi:MAG: hypothetical protein P8Y63_09040 [Deltaproteobacteria bacterium]|jgi:hypothetical protein
MKRYLSLFVLCLFAISVSLFGCKQKEKSEVTPPAGQPAQEQPMQGQQSDQMQQPTQEQQEGQSGGMQQPQGGQSDQTQGGQEGQDQM